MRPKIPTYRFRGQDTKPPSAGESAGNGFVSKSACYSGAPGLLPKGLASPSAEIETDSVSAPETTPSKP